MILFFRTRSKSVIATEADHKLSKEEISELSWLYGDAEPVDNDQLEGYFVGPRREMVTPWSTNAVEITQNMALKGISRIEEYFPVDTPEADHDPMLQRMYDGLDQQIFTMTTTPSPSSAWTPREVQRGGGPRPLARGDRLPPQDREGERTPAHG